MGLTRELASHEDVAEVFLLTQSIEGEEGRFATPREQIGPGATIVRLDFGPDGYVPSAEMWPYRLNSNGGFGDRPVLSLSLEQWLQPTS